MFVVDQNKTRTSTICQDVRVLFWSTTNKIYWEKILSITLVLLSSKETRILPIFGTFSGKNKKKYFLVDILYGLLYIVEKLMTWGLNWTALETRHTNFNNTFDHKIPLPANVTMISHLVISFDIFIFAFPSVSAPLSVSKAIAELLLSKKMLGSCY